MDVDAALTYLGFVEARHEAWEARQRGEAAPWTAEPLVASRKFTNVFRVLDHGSQFLVRELLDPALPAREVLMRCFLYRHTNLPSAWEAYRTSAGSYPTLDTLPELQAFWQSYRDEGGQVFSGAYMIYPQTHVKGSDKIEQIIGLTSRLFGEQDIMPEFLSADTQVDRFAILRRNKGVADFMSMQILTDWGYSSQCGEDREDEMVVLGPGARRGALALDQSGHVDATLLWAVEAVRSSPRCPTIETPSGVPRPPSYMDVQNTLCEFSKHVRFAKKPVPVAPYRPAHPDPQDPPVLPKHW